MRVLPSGEASLTIEFGTAVEPALSARVLDLFDAVSAAPPPGLVEAVPTLRSLTLHFDPLVTTAAEIEAAVRPLLDRPARSTETGRAWTLPACYDPDFGLDLAEVAAAASMTPAEVVAAHANRPYRVMMLGFLPGFPYMGETAPALRLPRWTTPRTAVPAGSIAIAASMTVVYTAASPGGWHILGRTPAILFDPAAREPVLLAPGDTVTFRAIERAEFDRLDAAARSGAWRPVPTATRGSP